MTEALTVPGDKSLTHRALMLAALADGRSTIRRPLDGADTRSTAAALRALGCDIAFDSDAVTVGGRGLRGLRRPADVIDCGNSGTTARLLMGVLAGQPFDVVLTGDASLRSRPMRRVLKPLAAMGARFDELGEPDRLPVRVSGAPLRPLDYDSPHASAQVKSAILLAALTGGVGASVTEPVLSRDHTERMLAHFGVPVRRESTAQGPRVSVEPVERLAPFEFDVPGDFSSAAFIIAVACLTDAVRLCDVGLNPTRTGFLDVLRRMGANVRIETEHESCGEPVGDVVIEPSSLRAAHIGGADIPSLIDEIPVLAVLAARAEGTTVIEGAGELRFKESDRIAALVANLKAVGVEAEERRDGLVIQGTDRPLRGTVRALHDHRIAMAFGVLGTSADAAIEIDDTSIVDVSFPGFWTMLRRIRAGVVP